MKINPAELVQILQISAGEGPRQFSVRCRIPFSLDVPHGGWGRTKKETEEQRAVDGTASTDGDVIITGPASSTSVDWYETRMTVDALRSMAAQFAAGVDYFPRHHGFLSRVEWYETIGRTVGAELRKESVANPSEHNDGNDHILYVDTRLDMEEENARKLVRKIDAGNPPGQSIGGWFTEVAVIYDEDDWPIDIAILDVELDHLAAVRSPANEDADRIWRAVGLKLQAAVRGQDGSEIDRMFDPVSDLTGSAPDEQSNDARSSDDCIVSVPEAVNSAAESDERTGSIQALRGTERTNDILDSNPPAAEDTRTAEMEIDMDPKELAKLLGEAIDQALEARGVGVVPPAAPAPAASAGPATDDSEALRAELAAERSARVAAEARASAAEQMGTNGRQSGARTERPQAAAEPIEAARDGMYHGLNLREVAPMSVRAVARSFGELDLTADLVDQLDGPEALAQLAKADGSGKSLSELVLVRNTDLVDSNALAKRSTAELEDMLREVIVAGLKDGTVNPRTRPAGSWA